MLVTIHRQYHCHGCFWCGGPLPSDKGARTVFVERSKVFRLFPNLFCCPECADLAYEFYRGETYARATEKARWG